MNWARLFWIIFEISGPSAYAQLTPTMSEVQFDRPLTLIDLILGQKRGQTCFSALSNPSPEEYFYKDCSAFLDEYGNLGSLGKVIRSHLLEERRSVQGYPHRKTYDVYFDSRTPNVRELCPLFPFFKDEEKANFWVFVFAAIAFRESNCGHNPAAYHSPLGQGLFQLEHSVNPTRKYRGTNCQVKDVGPNRQNLLCALDMMRDQLLGRHAADFRTLTEERGGIEHSNSYWRLLRPKSPGTTSMIGERIKTYPLCGNRKRGSLSQ